MTLSGVGFVISIRVLFFFLLMFLSFCLFVKKEKKKRKKDEVVNITTLKKYALQFEISGADF